MRMLVCLCLMGGFLFAQQTPCDAEHKGQFDFWIGHWEVFDSQGNKVGENVIKPLFDGCVLQETWTGAQGSKGTSLNFFNPQQKMWEQFWTYQNGITLHIRGGLDDKAMVMQGHTQGKDGSKTLNRNTWTSNEDGSVRQHGEQSKDEGKTFATAFDGLYKKK